MAFWLLLEVGFWLWGRAKADSGLLSDVLGVGGRAARWPSGRGSVSGYGFVGRRGFVVWGRWMVAVVFC